MLKPSLPGRFPVWTSGFAMALALIGPPAGVSAAALPDSVPAVRQKADDLARRGLWADALELYVRLPRGERDPELYPAALRHVMQARRLRDRPAQVVLGQLTPAQALGVYREALDKLHTRYVDRSRVTPALLFGYGVQEMRFALEDEVFLREHLAGARPEAVQSLRDRLDSLRDGLREGKVAVGSLKEARDQLQTVMLAAAPLGLKPPAVMLEFICGATNALDEYTLFLGPRQLAGLEADLGGRSVGVGVDLAVVDQKVVLARVVRNSPAGQAMLAPGDRVLRIDGQVVDGLPAEAAARLLGDEGTAVEVEVQPAGLDGMPPPPPRTVRLERRAVVVPSIEAAYELKEQSGIGYVKLATFQRTTLQELKDAILQLQSQSMGLGLRALVIDLRGNPGGYFPAAVQVAELFLPEGVIVHTQTRSREEAYRASNPQALAMPLVLLVDGETASAAEIVAGALKENSRATVVGQPTFGKGTVQCVVRLDTIHSGLQVTMARFYSPSHVSYEGRGLTPDRFVERTPMGAPVAGPMMADLPREVALQVAEQLVKASPPR